MKQVCVYVLLMLLPVASMCQTRLSVSDKYSAQAIGYVTVTNKRTLESVRTDEKGKCILTIRNGDSVIFSHPAYTFTIKRMNNNTINVQLYPRTNTLKEVEVLSPQAKYERDSATRQAIYHKTIADAKRKPKAGFSNGLVLEGGISKLAMKVSGKDKKNKKFVKKLEADNRQRFIDTRYTLELVASLTPLRGDTIIFFKEAHPMPYDFARAATIVEIKMWVRDQYKLWQKHPVIPADTFTDMRIK